MNDELTDDELVDAIWDLGRAVTVIQHFLDDSFDTNTVDTARQLLTKYKGVTG